MKRLVAAAFYVGIFASGAMAQAVIARVDTNGILKGYVVQKGGKTICRDPFVQNQFRGPTSYITCQ